MNESESESKCTPWSSINLTIDNLNVSFLYSWFYYDLWCEWLRLHRLCERKQLTCSELILVFWNRLYYKNCQKIHYKLCYSVTLICILFLVLKHWENCNKVIVMLVLAYLFPYTLQRILVFVSHSLSACRLSLITNKCHYLNASNKLTLELQPQTSLWLIKQRKTYL